MDYLLNRTNQGDERKPSFIELILIPTMAACTMLAISTNGAFAQNQKPSFTHKGDKLCITGNGMPNHAYGEFPNSGNPNTISKQNVSLCVTKNPKKTGSAKKIRGSVGVALNGVQIRPGTADYYDPSSPRGHSRNRNSGWNLEGLGAADKLGMDKNNAHVDERGLYHYHGVSGAFVKAGKGSLVGYAADGFEIHYAGGRVKSSYKLKSGKRPSAPRGRYDGTYNEDFQYVAGSGNLDQCNGGTLNGKFVYFATHDYPFFPRCVWGTVSKDFMHKSAPRREAAFGQGAKRHKRADRKRLHAQGKHRKIAQGGGRRPPKQAINACQTKQANAKCSFSGRGGKNVRGSCRQVRGNVVACVPQRRGG